MLLEAPCKINLGLDILRRRADGYHDLETVMFPVRGLCDRLLIEPLPAGRVEFIGQGLEIDCSAEKNLCVQAARLIAARCGAGGVRITLDKRVPFGAGLGGGSSDATAVLQGLNGLYSLQLSEEQLIALAAELGSDTAFFVREDAQLCTGRGEVMRPIEVPLAGCHLVIVKPAEGISTGRAYAGVQPRIPALPLATRIARPMVEWQGSVTNDFEPTVFAACPSTRLIRDSLLAAGALYASLSGSGSALFGIFDHPVTYTPPIPGLFLHTERIG